MTKLRFLKDIARQMSKNSRSRRTSNKQHGKRSQTLLKSAWKHLHHIYWSIWKTLIWEKSLLAIGKILGLFVNTLTGDDKYWLINCDKSTQSILMKLFNKQKTFSLFFFFFLHFWILDQILNIFKKSMTLLASVFLILTSVSEDPSTSIMVNGTKHCWNLHDNTFLIFIDHCKGNWVRKSLA